MRRPIFFDYSELVSGIFAGGAYDGANGSAICVQKITKDSLKDYYSTHNFLR
ncbi:hypothetical protein CGSMWGv6119V5_05937 [Gardnerella vaginalis 6119V5]|nr:hypothetical protein CGSMWGv6119V5_05937 [Gardnerella vaginalis 6119V5]